MQRILSKRVLRDIRENLLRYLALFFLVAMVMYMVVAIVGASETIMQGTEESAAVHHREDGQFGVFVPLTDSEVTQITDKGVTVQQDFSLDFHQGQATLRIYQAREKIESEVHRITMQHMRKHQIPLWTAICLESDSSRQRITKH